SPNGMFGRTFTRGFRSRLVHKWIAPSTAFSASQHFPIPLPRKTLHSTNFHQSIDTFRLAEMMWPEKNGHEILLTGESKHEKEALQRRVQERGGAADGP